MTTNSHGDAAIDFATVYSCDQVVYGPFQASGGTHVLLITDVPDLAPGTVVAPLGSSEHSALTSVITTTQAVPSLSGSRIVFLKTKLIATQFGVHYRTIHGVTIGLLTTLLRS